MNNLSKIAILAAMATGHGLIYFMNINDGKGPDKHSRSSLNETLLKKTDGDMRMPLYGDGLWGGNATSHLVSDEMHVSPQAIIVKGGQDGRHSISWIPVNSAAPGVSRSSVDENIHLVTAKKLGRKGVGKIKPVDNGNDPTSESASGPNKSKTSTRSTVVLHEVSRKGDVVQHLRRTQRETRKAAALNKLDQHMSLAGFEGASALRSASRTAQVSRNLRASRTRGSLISGDIFDPYMKKMKLEALRENRDRRRPHEYRQSTHTTETHDSITNSIHRLMERYGDTLYSADIFDYVAERMMAAYPDDLQFEYIEAMGEARRVFGSDIGRIESLVMINPHDRDEEDDSDTKLNAELNVIVRYLNGQKDKIDLVRRIARLYASQDILFNALQMIGHMRSNPEYQEKFTQIGYEDALRLFVAALEDKDYLDKDTATDDLPSARWRVFVERMALAANEYRPSVTACAAGIFNAIFETLDGIHPDVRIVPSLRLMMQSISDVEDDDEFLRLAVNALRLVEPDPARDDYYRVMDNYQKIILEFYRERPSQLGPEERELAGLRRTLIAGMDLDDDDFSTLQAELVANLSLSIQPVLIHAVLTQVEEERNSYRRAPGLGNSTRNEDDHSL